MSVITFSGQAGTGAREIGRLVADTLGIDYVDQEILVEAATELGVPMEAVVTHDERTAGLGERLATMFRRFLERSATAGAADPMMGGGLDAVLARTYGEAAQGEGMQDVSDERYIETLTGVIRELAGHDDVLIIGRGSQVILFDWPASLHVLLVAPLEDRVASVQRRDGLSQEAAAKLVHDTGHGRADFHRKFFKIDVDDASHYHLTLNTTRLTQQQAADLVCDAARRISPPSPPA